MEHSGSVECERYPGQMRQFAANSVAGYDKPVINN